MEMEGTGRIGDEILLDNPISSYRMNSMRTKSHLLSFSRQATVAAASSLIFVGAIAAQAAAPPAPAGLKATAGTATVALSWTAVAGATKYTVKRAVVAAGPYPVVKSVTAASFAESPATGLIPGRKYYYVVTASNASGEGKPSTVVEATGIFVAPSALTAAAGLNQVSLVWKGSPGATKYNVERSTTANTGFKIVTTAAIPRFTDTSATGLGGGKTYYYAVAAVDAAGLSSLSAQAKATPLATGTAVSATVNLTANRHPISPYIYGANFPPSTAYIQTAGVTGVADGM